MSNLMLESLPRSGRTISPLLISHQLINGVCSVAQLNDVAVTFTMQDLVERRCSEMTTPASPSEVHHRRRRRRGTGDQTNDTVTGWGGLGAAHSSLPLPAREPDGTFHQVRSLPCLVSAGPVHPVLRKFKRTVSHVHLQCTGT